MNGSSQSPEFLDRPSPESHCCGGNSDCATDSPGSVVAEAVPARDACPPPLQWQHVVAAFREQAEQWHAETTAGVITGRVWGEGPTLVFFNGLGGSHELFALCVYLLKAQCRCVLLDYPVGRRVSWKSLCD